MFNQITAYCAKEKVKEMNNDQLHSFITVAQKKSFSEAARILYVSQPTITSQIKALESELNTSLFIRTKKSVEVTPAGEMLLEYAQQILDLQVQAKNKLASLEDELQGTLFVASSLTIGESVLPMLLHNFKSRFSYVNLKTDITNSQHIVNMIKNGELEIGLIEAELREPALNIEPFMDDELVLFSHCNYFSEDRDAILLKELTSVPIVMREEGSGTRTVIQNHLKELGIPPEKLNIVLELGSTESVKTAVESGIGVSILSKSAIRKELNANIFQTFPIEDVTLGRQFYLVYKKNKTLSLISQSFFDIVMENKFTTPKLPGGWH
ncbi:selenium metabolism-associated LysR family transcriptional regulator [Salsuginibacillus kocurii]|uniref:selenium metabolism-associated LysR family transcriptional regulator n=1 Tax=Salsuginibacillus kocurii TaxID=427078 RepID=UPI0003A304EB|nr:selenium metabolism-associated LysR family transcriptional regulator [Salsuginibacillus kocurii]